jgi:hypothetical protein
MLAAAEESSRKVGEKKEISGPRRRFDFARIQRPLDFSRALIPNVGRRPVDGERPELRPHDLSLFWRSKQGGSTYARMREACATKRLRSLQSTSCSCANREPRLHEQAGTAALLLALL